MNAMSEKVSVNEVKAFWESHPLCVDGISYEPGSLAFYERHNVLRAMDEPLPFQMSTYEFDKFSGKALLDVGCGNGFVAVGYARFGAHVTAVDLTTKAVELTKQRFKVYGIDADKGGHHFLQANAESLPFADESFDVVTCYGVIHHTTDTARAIDEIFRVLKPGGQLRLMVYHRNSVIYRVKFPYWRVMWREVRGKTQQEMVNRVDGILNPLGKVYSKAEVRELTHKFVGHLFVTSPIQATDFPQPFIAAIIPMGVMGWLSRRFGWFLYLAAQKP